MPWLPGSDLPSQYKIKSFLAWTIENKNESF